ncbi:MAG: TATA-box-binding protein [Candidatus Nanohaloarchaeota archaeon]|nr:TATA-box-binding protein [Candidatus Nanohaloarchaeota archaeon]
MEWDIRVHNVVASMKVNDRIPLTRLAEYVENVEYEPDQFPGLVLRLNEPRSAALIFSNGKVVSTGTKSAREAQEAIDRLMSIFNELEIPVKNEKYKIDNVVASTHVGKSLNLTNIAFSLEETEYEPDQFPGLVYRQSETGVVFLMFRTGKIICTGAKSEEQIIESFKVLYSKLKEIGEI